MFVRLVRLNNSGREFIFLDRYFHWLPLAASDFIPCKQALIKELTSLFFFAHLRS